MNHSLYSGCTEVQGPEVLAVFATRGDHVHPFWTLTAVVVVVFDRSRLRA
eukprot:CAMPEP_0179176198 /NCGR_PEP_ID=MMETSP0796-20121207/87098_1 /TAXON_ID=73915 /ORGANISM="Pyrodinium bahamense, Strain pbaha01" /LENGTH=49 /DNA_ID= /DNA_START= /DNA_END= /DNA_ORIENTATION=